MDAEPTKAEKLYMLVALLNGQEVVEWHQVEYLIEDYPGWASLVENLHYPRQYNFTWRTPTRNPFEFPQELTLAERSTLFGILEPYAILLNPSLDKSQKVERIEACIEFNERVRSFWAETLENPDPQIHTATVELLEWVEAHRSLLRGTAHPETQAEELLRAAKPTASNTENLLRSGETPEEIPPKPAGLWERLWRRR